MQRGTVLVGRASGSEYDRAFITVIGYLDSRDIKLVKMSGEVMGSDGGQAFKANASSSTVAVSNAHSARLRRAICKRQGSLPRALVGNGRS